jgi:tRNA(Ile)-lysidine synthase
VRRTIRQHDLAGPDSGIVVALSGGSDSVALAHLLVDLERGGELRVAGFAHFNHQLRAQADADERFCESMAVALGKTLAVDRADVAAIARRDRRSIEDAGRQARHGFLERARAQLGADLIALGHTRDDQAETFLLRLLRGAGARGLGGMHPRRGAVIRPLLDCRRAELQEYLAARGIDFVHDASNDDVNVPRNRVRAELLPMLERRFNPAIVDVLATEAQVAREEWRWMEASAREAMTRICHPTAEGCRIDAAALIDLPVALSRLVLKTAMERVAGGRSLSFTHVDEALRFCRGGGACLDLPGQVLERNGREVVLTSRPERRPDGGATATTNLFRYSLSIPGEVRIEETGGYVSAELVEPRGRAVVGRRFSIAPSPDVAFVQLDPVSGPLVVRNRRPGDRFRPLGLGGGKKLQDFFVDRKIARERRDRVPIVVDQSGRIVWVAGYGIDERFRVTDAAQAVVVLRLRQV